MSTTLARVCSLAVILAAIALPVCAADHLKPGEWQVAVKVSQKGGPQIPPEQIEQMKQMGIPNPLAGHTINTVQCITPELAASDKPFGNDARDPNKCQVANYKRVGSKATGEMVCTGEFKGKGLFEMTLDSDTEYHSAWTIKGVSDSLGPVEQTTELRGKWARAACDPAKK